MAQLERRKWALLVGALGSFLSGISCTEPNAVDSPGSGGSVGDPWYCLAAGTRIATPDGSRVVEKLKPGDLVVSFDERSRLLRANRVIGNRVARRRIGVIPLPGGGSLRGTGEHPVFESKSGSYIPLSRLSADASLLRLSPAWEAPALYHEGMLWTERELSSTFSLTGTFSNVYNLSVERDHNYFAEGVLVHNKSPPCESGGSCWSEYCGPIEARLPIVCTGPVAVIQDASGAQVVIPETELDNARARGLEILSLPPADEAAGGAGGEGFGKEIVVAFSLEPNQGADCYDQPSPFLTATPGQDVEIAFSHLACPTELAFEPVQVDGGSLTLQLGIYTHVRIPTAALSCLRLGKRACEIGGGH